MGIEVALKSEADNLLQYANERDLVLWYNNPSKIKEFVASLNGGKNMGIKNQKHRSKLVQLARNNHSFKEEYDKLYEEDQKLIKQLEKIVEENKTILETDFKGDLTAKLETALTESVERSDELVKGVKKDGSNVEDFVEEFSNERSKFHKISGMKQLLQNEK